jgi:hypothetical protein
MIFLCLSKIQYLKSKMAATAVHSFNIGHYENEEIIFLKN